VLAYRLFALLFLGKPQFDAPHSMSDANCLFRVLLTQKTLHLHQKLFHWATGRLVAIPWRAPQRSVLIKPPHRILLHANGLSTYTRQTDGGADRSQEALARKYAGTEETVAGAREKYSKRRLYRKELKKSERRLYCCVGQGRHVSSVSARGAAGS
jgi:hypothetical protein